MFATELKSKSNGTVYTEIIPVPNLHREIENVEYDEIGSFKEDAKTRSEFMNAIR